MLAPLVTMTPPSIDDPSSRRDVGPPRRRPQVPGAAPPRRLPAAALGADGRRRPRRPSSSRPSCCGPSSPRAASTAPSRAPGPPARASASSSRRRPTPTPPGPATFVRGGMGALTQALAAAARGFGAEIRTGATVARDRDQGRRGDGRRALDAARRSRRGPSSRTPTRSGRSSPCVDPGRPRPGLRPEDPELPRDGRRREGQPRALGPARVPRRRTAGGAETSSSGRIHIGPDIDYLERAYDAAKYGDFSPHPYCDVTIPTLTDPSLAPPGKHVMSVIAQFAPVQAEGRRLERRKREALGDAVVETLAAYAPGLQGARRRRGRS